jgi:type II restriction enzyme
MPCAFSSIQTPFWSAAFDLFSIFYLAGDLQNSEMFKPRAPLSDRARRAGWQGFVYDLSSVGKNFVRLK